MPAWAMPYGRCNTSVMPARAALGRFSPTPGGSLSRPLRALVGCGGARRHAGCRKMLRNSPPPWPARQLRCSTSNQPECSERLASYNPPAPTRPPPRASRAAAPTRFTGGLAGIEPVGVLFGLGKADLRPPRPSPLTKSSLDEDTIVSAPTRADRTPTWTCMCLVASKARSFRAPSCRCHRAPQPCSRGSSC